MAFIITPPHLLRPQNLRSQLRRPHICAATPSPLSNHSLTTLLTALRAHPPPSGCPQTVHLVGVGPGDPGLLTLSALRHMQTAEVVLYDRLITPEILRLVNPHATMVYVGKESGFHTRSQHDIHLLLNFFANSGKKVVRLKGGDPLIFGRGGEEISYLSQQGVHVRSVPGVTAAAGIAADLGIPLTMRGVANSVTFLTGHAREGCDIDIGSVDNSTTYVVYMGLGQLPTLVHAFLNGGVSADIPAMAVERGTTTAQRAIAGTLEQICDRVHDAELKSPTLIFVGEVVRFARVWGRDHVVEGALDTGFEQRDVFGVQQQVLDRAFDMIEEKVSHYAT